MLTAARRWTFAPHFGMERYAEELMKRLVVGLGLLAVAIARPAYAGTPTGGCCACFVPDHDSDVTAFFCASPITPADDQAVSDRCGAIPDAALICTVMSTDPQSAVTSDCAEQLRLDHILCPDQASVPALGSSALAGAVGLLGALGAWTLRRRSAISA